MFFEKRMFKINVFTLKKIVSGSESDANKFNWFFEWEQRTWIYARFVAIADIGTRQRGWHSRRNGAKEEGGNSKTARQTDQFD